MVGSFDASWSGREVDILFLHIENPSAPSIVRSNMVFGEKTLQIAGIQKAVQSFVSLLLTRRGTSARADLGTDFITAAQQGRIRTNADLQNQTALASSDAVRQVNQQAVRPDERIASAVLLSSAVERQSITLRIRVTTEAGSRAVFLVPIER